MAASDIQGSRASLEVEQGAPSGLLKGGREQLRGVPLLEDVGFFLVPEFSLMTFSAALEVLRHCNRVTGEKLYRWHVLSEDGKPVCSSGGVCIDSDAALGESAPLDFLMVFAGINAERYYNKSIFGRLRSIAQGGCCMGSASAGTYILAHAGLLDGHRCTVHWEDMECFREAFPHLRVGNEVFEADGSTR